MNDESITLSESEKFDDDKVFKVAIIGAGAAGLQCAHRLVHEHNWDPLDIVILEARERIGGRIYSSVFDAGNQEVVVDFGAAWVHGTGHRWNDESSVSAEENTTNPMIDLLKKEAKANGRGSIYQNQLMRVCDGNPWMRPNFILYQGGHLAVYMEGELLAKDDPSLQLGLNLYCQRFQAACDYTNAHFKAGRGLDTFSLSLQQGLGRFDAKGSNRTVECLALFFGYLVECWYGSTTEEIQLCEFSDEEVGRDDEYTEEGDFFGPHCVLEHGMKSVLEPLCDEVMMKQIQKGFVVTKVHLGAADSISVSSRDGRCIRAFSCVSTMSVGCLQEATKDQDFFSPPLHQTKVDAINKINRGNYKKVLMRFETIFWPKETAFLGLVVPDAVNSPLGCNLLMDNLWARRGLPILEAILIGNAAVWAKNRADKDVSVAVLAFMEAAMGSNIPDCLSSHVSRWEEDPFSMGAYSSLGLGAADKHVREFREAVWDGRLCFSGEATASPFEGSVHGALQSGVAAADHISSLVA